MARLNPRELFPVVDEQGNVVGSALRGECHGGSRLLHPVVHLHVVDSAGRVLLQKRSMLKDIQPGRWDTAVGGHVDYGETIGEALIREAGEEIGIAADSGCFMLKRYVFESDRERELVTTFILRVEGNEAFSAPADEIDELRFWLVEEITAQLGQGVFTPNFEREFREILLPYLSGGDE